MQKGTVIRFNAIKGYGFIKTAESNDEIFVHFSAIQSEGYKALEVGQHVSFELEQGEKGAYAANVIVSE